MKLKNTQFLNSSTKIIVVLLLFVYGFAYVQAQAQPMQFFVGDTEQTKKMGEMVKKPIVIYLYTSYTPACRKMEKHVFTDPDVAKFYESSFVSAKVNLNSKEGLKLRKQYELHEYPAFIYLTHEGELILKEEGEKNAAEFIAMGKSVCEKKMQVSVSNQPLISPYFTSYLDLRIQYNNGSRHSDFIRNYALQRREFSDPYMHIVEDYIDNNVDFNLTDVENLKFVYEFAESIESKAFTLMVANRQHFSNFYDKEEIDNKIKEAIRSSVITAANDNNDKLFLKATKVIDNTNVDNTTNDFQREMKLLYFEKTQQWNAYANLVTDYVENTKKPTASLYITSAWNIVLNIENKDYLFKAVNWTEKAVEMQPYDYETHEANAALLYRIGKKSKALRAIDEALTLARKKGVDYTSTIKLKEAIGNDKEIDKDLK